ncbi:GNAT family N-acetyltransferase [Pelagovum pacificum]|uniref:GNAT family N-acetyltransferase n=1 Tax=Pelagovum pacificum TaxID=2588711 RepID=A0A5C5G9P5_9RHOB|nr:GNAT family N-acetyltransferase [Pelagovum pacificum]QQA42207.1 GNAT family N-acetyltransferase [Pelagovum pacificum]TNY31293.1 GNAT family N-acetyltransferase [Pelagovum pacificum]
MKDLIPPPISTDATVRRFEYADLPVLDRMVRQIADHHGDVARHTPTTLLRDVTGSAPLAKVLMSVVDDKPRGFAATMPALQLHNGIRGVEIHLLWVDDGWRNRGLGRQLIETVTTRARIDGAHYVRVSAHRGNRRAQAYYESLGFERTGESGTNYMKRL